MALCSDEWNADSTKLRMILVHVPPFVEAWGVRAWRNGGGWSEAELLLDLLLAVWAPVSPGGTAPKPPSMFVSGHSHIYQRGSPSTTHLSTPCFTMSQQRVLDEQQRMREAEREVEAFGFVREETDALRDQERREATCFEDERERRFISSPLARATYLVTGGGGAAVESTRHWDSGVYQVTEASPHYVTARWTHTYLNVTAHRLDGTSLDSFVLPFDP
jgi:hypothetical protein